MVARWQYEKMLVEAVIGWEDSGVTAAQMKHIRNALGMGRSEFDDMVRDMIDRGVLRVTAEGRRKMTRFDAFDRRPRDL